MRYTEYNIDALVQIFDGPAAWFFIFVPKDTSLDIKKGFGDRSRGWGSLPVEVTVGETIWRTSIFYDRKEEKFMLPLKASVRKAENIIEGKRITISIEIII